jgi:hypothetical protein
MTLQLKGALLAKQDGNVIQYRRQCDQCGYLEGTVQSTKIDGPGGLFTLSYTCYFCDARQQIEITL